MTLPSPTGDAPPYLNPPLGYEKYLRRKLWKTIRARVLERDGGRCFRCGGNADEVHHRSYGMEVMNGFADEWLVSLCQGCHTVVEFDDKGTWRTWHEKERVLFAPDASTDIPEPVINPRLRQWKIDPPIEWLRMSGVQRSLWISRSHELYLESRKLRHLPVEVLYPDRVAAEAAAYSILDKQPALDERFRSSGEILHLALLSQGYELLPNSRRMKTGYRPAAAKKRFEKALIGKSWSPHVLLSSNDRMALESAAIWNLRK